jgi:plastocyanin
MSHLRTRSCFIFGVFATWCASICSSGQVVVNVKTTGAGSPEDTVIVFDPLEAGVPATHAKTTIDQIDRRFTPRVSVMRTGTTVTFTNSDHIKHQVYSFSPAKVFSLKLYAGAPETPIVFDRPGLVVLGCNIHDSMIAYVGIVDSPYFAKVPASGSVDMSLPAGRYRLRIWHPNLAAAMPAKEIAITAAPLSLPIAVDLTGNPASIAVWPE